MNTKPRAANRIGRGLPDEWSLRDVTQNVLGRPRLTEHEAGEICRRLGLPWKPKGRSNTRGAK